MEVIGVILFVVLFFLIEIFYLAPALSWWVNYFATRKLRKTIQKGNVNINDIVSQFVK